MTDKTMFHLTAFVTICGIVILNPGGFSRGTAGNESKMPHMVFKTKREGYFQIHQENQLHELRFVMNECASKGATQGEQRST